MNALRAKAREAKRLWDEWLDIDSWTMSGEAINAIGETLALAALEPKPPCPDCLPGDGVWFGPCADGRSHRPWCPIGRNAMAEARWPCGVRKYPDVVAAVGAWEPKA